MSDPFGDLDETLDEADDPTRGEDTTADGDESGEAVDAGEPTQPATGDTPDGSVTGDGDGDTGDSESLPPAFPFAEADQTAVYPRAETWAAFEDFLDFEVRRRLREAGVRDDTKRELHEAVLQVVRDHPEAVAEQFLDNRRDAGDESTE